MDINKLKKEHQRHVKLIEELRVKVDQAEALQRVAVEEATRPLIEEIRRINERWLGHSNELSMEVISHQKVGEDLLASIRAHQKETASLVTRVGELTSFITDQNEKLSKKDDRIQELVRQVEEAQKTPELMQFKIDALTALMDKVQTRMRRKEKLEADAILNRKAVTFRPPTYKIKMVTK